MKFLFAAAEYRYFCLYISPMVLYQYLPKEYFKHWMLLVHGVYLLSKQHLLESEIEAAKANFKLFAAQTEFLYGEEHMNLHVHLLLHFDNQGIYFCFQFEFN